MCTTPDDLGRSRWRDWAASANEALSSLRARCELVFIAGVSMGALLALQLAVHPPNPSGIVLYSPALRFAQRGLFWLRLALHLKVQWPKGAERQTDVSDPSSQRYLWRYETVPARGVHELTKLQRAAQAQMPRIRVPAIIFFSTGDQILHRAAGKLAFARLGSADKELVTLHNP